MSSRIPESIRFARRADESHGFTLIELLVVIVIIVVLIALSSVALHKAMLNVQRQDSLNNLRQLAMGVQSYAGDHDGYPPGPMTITQWPYMKRKNTTQLSWVLADYLGWSQAPQGQIIKTLGHKRFFATCDPTQQTAYLLNIRTGISGQLQSPWGWTGNGRVPLKLLLIDIPPKSIGAMEGDQQLLDFSGGKAVSAAPEKPLFDDGRAAFFFDGHVEVVPMTYQIGSPYN